MKHSMARFALRIATLAMTPMLTLCMPSIAAEVGPVPPLGKPAPDFSLADTKGKSHDLANYKGKIVVLEWFNDGCPFVKKHYDSNNMQTLQKDFTGKGVVWLTINSSAPGKQGYHEAADYDKLMTEHKAHPTAVLLDHDGKVGMLYGARTTPDMYVIDKKGILVYSGAIDDVRSADASDIPKAKNYVKEVLDQELSGKTSAIAATQSYGCSVKYAE